MNEYPDLRLPLIVRSIQDSLISNFFFEEWYYERDRSIVNTIMCLKAIIMIRQPNNEPLSLI